MDNNKEIERHEAATNYGYAVAGGSAIRPTVSQAFIDGAKWAEKNIYPRWVDAKKFKPIEDRWVLLHLCIGNHCHYTWQGCWDGKRWVQRTDIQVGDSKGFDGIEVLHWLEIPLLEEQGDDTEN